MKTGIELIAQERKEQLEKHGRTVERDVKENSRGQLVGGIKALAMERPEYFPFEWDEEICKHMMKKPWVEILAIIGAFAAAEIDRINTNKYIENTDAEFLIK